MKVSYSIAPSSKPEPLSEVPQSLPSEGVSAESPPSLQTQLSSVQQLINDRLTQMIDTQEIGQPKQTLKVKKEAKQDDSLSGEESED